MNGKGGRGVSEPKPREDEDSAEPASGTILESPGRAVRLSQLARALDKSEALATALLAATPDVVIGIGEGGIIEDICSQQHTPFGEGLMGLVGGALATVVAGPDQACVSEAVRVTLSTGETSVVVADVQEPLGVTRVEIRIVKSGPSQGLALIRDITQQRTAEDRLRLTDRLVSLGTLVGGVAHEINNPLSYLINNLDFLKTGLKRESANRELEIALDEAREGAERIRDIVATLKEHSRPDKGDLVPVDLNAAVRSALRILDNQIRQRAVVELRLDDLPLVFANGRIVQVIVNLVSNAIQAMPDRSPRENLISVRTFRRVTGEVLLEVEDNGAGIPRAILGSIFDPFFTTKGPGGGTGLGLYLCHCLVTSFDGTISVSSGEGLGSNFAVSLRAAERAPSRKASARPQAAETRSFLIVDDDPLVARALSRLLGGNVTVANSGVAALALCGKRDFDIIVCDMMMPEMDGVAFYEALSATLPSLVGRVVFVTGGAFTERTRNFIQSVPNPTLSKPFSCQELLDTADGIMGAS